jgi:hypothetical protein
MFDDREFLYTFLQVPLYYEDANTRTDSLRQRNDVCAVEKIEGVHVGVTVTNGIEAGQDFDRSISVLGKWSGYLYGQEPNAPR